jgi:hypothetical protein
MDAPMAVPGLAGAIRVRMAVLGPVRATLPDSDLLRHLLLEAYELAPHLKAFAAVPLLRSAAAEVVHSPEIALRRRLHDNSLTVTRLARAMHEAHQSGLRADQILDILNSTGISRIPVRSFDNVLREAQALQYHRGARPGEDARRTSEEDLFNYYALIVEGALGSEYGRQFTEYLTVKLQSETYSRKEIRRALSRRRSLWTHLSPFFR